MIPTQRADSVSSSSTLNISISSSTGLALHCGIGSARIANSKERAMLKIPSGPAQPARGAVLGSQLEFSPGGGNMPTRYPQEAVLRDGRRLLVRPFTENDVDSLYEFFLHLPQEVRRF